MEDLEGNERKINMLKGELSHTGKYQRCSVCQKFILVPRLNNHISYTHRKELAKIQLGENS